MFRSRRNLPRHSRSKRVLHRMLRRHRLLRRPPSRPLPRQRLVHRNRLLLPRHQVIVPPSRQQRPRPQPRRVPQHPSPQLRQGTRHRNLLLFPQHQALAPPSLRRCPRHRLHQEGPPRSLLLLLRHQGTRHRNLRRHPEARNRRRPRHPEVQNLQNAQSPRPPTSRRRPRKWHWGRRERRQAVGVVLLRSACLAWLCCWRWLCSRRVRS